MTLLLDISVDGGGNDRNRAPRDSSRRDGSRRRNRYLPQSATRDDYSKVARSCRPMTKVCSPQAARRDGSTERDSTMPTHLTEPQGTFKRRLFKSCALLPPMTKVL